MAANESETEKPQEPPPNVARWAHDSGHRHLHNSTFADALPALAQALSQSPTTFRAHIITGPVEHYYDPPLDAPPTQPRRSILDRLHSRIAALFGRPGTRPSTPASPNQAPSIAEQLRAANDRHSSVVEQPGLCGYRGMQMMLSWLIARGVVRPPPRRDNMPTLETLRGYLVKAWMSGISRQSAPALNERGQLVAPMGFVGTPEVSAVLKVLSVPHEYMQCLPTPHNPNMPLRDGAARFIASAAYHALNRIKDTMLHDFVPCMCDTCKAEYHTSKIRHIDEPPIYLQWAGHCVVVVGVEQRVQRHQRGASWSSRGKPSGKPTGGAWNLIVLDPSYDDVADRGRTGNIDRFLDQHRIWCGDEPGSEGGWVEKACGYSVAEEGEFELLMV